MAHRAVTSSEAKADILGSDDQLAIDKQILALDALSKLAKQFSNKPDFDQLNELLILTVSGQFAVPNACALIRQPGSQSPIPLFFGTGRYRNDRLLLSQELTTDHSKYFLENRTPSHIVNLTQDARTAKLGFVLSECNARIIAPLLHNDNLIGILGLGDKVTGKSFESSDLELLSTLVNAITPFLASSFLFSEISGLNTWYVDILNSIEQGVFIFDNNNLLKQVNRTGFNILKQFRPNLIHIETVHMLPIEVVFPDSVYGNWAKRFIKSRNNPQSGLLENMVAASGDSERIYNVHISRITGSSVLETDLIITLDDVTGQKQSEHRLFELQKFADQGVMASSISHELNNFLGLILGGVEVTQISLGKGDIEKVTANLEKLKTSVNKMERYTSGLMDYTKLDTRKRKSNLNIVISDVLSYVAAQKRFKRTRVLSDLDSKLPEFEMDADQMSQLLLNLLNNAADAINETNATSGEIVVRTMLHSGSAILVISDNGAGIKPEVKQKLFRAHMTTKENGHGYGLVTCAKIIDNHSGEVQIDSEPGNGTTFTFRFPIS
ncbi:MAG: ATP-binding protein [Candidatus Zixiibacteriota bacterium]